MVKCVALVWRGEPGTHFEASGLPPVGRALQARGLEVEDVPFSEEAADGVREQLLVADAALVWVDPISTRDGRDRSILDPLLRDVAARGTWVGAHPDAILKLGTKDILVKTKGLEWGSDCCLYKSGADLSARLPDRLRAGPEVLKRLRGNGGDGIWRVEALSDDPATNSDMTIRVLHARRGSTLEELSLRDFVARCGHYFEGGSSIIGQPFQDRLHEGQIRCYIVDGRVSGFGHHYVAGLLPLASGAAEPRNPRMYYGPSHPLFQTLKSKLEGGWIDQMTRTLGMHNDELPILWDADFFYGAKNPAGDDTYVLCEINASSVDIFPGETLDALADAVANRLRRPK